MTQPVEITFTEIATDKLANHEGRVALIVAPGGRLPAGLPAQHERPRCARWIPKRARR